MALSKTSIPSYLLRASIAHRQSRAGVGAGPRHLGLTTSRARLWRAVIQHGYYRLLGRGVATLGLRRLPVPGAFESLRAPCLLARNGPLEDLVFDLFVVFVEQRHLRLQHGNEGLRLLGCWVCLAIGGINRLR